MSGGMRAKYEGEGRRVEGQVVSVTSWRGQACWRVTHLASRSLRIRMVSEALWRSESCWLIARASDSSGKRHNLPFCLPSIRAERASLIPSYRTQRARVGGPFRPFSQSFCPFRECTCSIARSSLPMASRSLSVAWALAFLSLSRLNRRSDSYRISQSHHESMRGVGFAVRVRVRFRLQSTPPHGSGRAGQAM